MDNNKKDISPISTQNGIILHKKNTISVFLNKKTEKIAAAVYLLTDLMPPTDPLRSELRSCSLELLGATLSGDESGKESMARFARKLLSLLQVGYYAHLISEMNQVIFKREIEALIGHIEGRFSRAGEVSLSSIFFQIDNLGHESDVRPKAENAYKRHQQDMPFKKVSNQTNNKVFEIKKEKNKRHEEIMNFFRSVKRSDVSIKDISVVMKDCSENTIQRELIDSVQKGLLRKEGERRWSRYSLV